MRRHSWVKTAVVFLVLASAACGAPRECDVWYAFVADGQRYGHQHVVVTRLPDGNFRYSTDVRILLDLFGSQRQEITSHSEHVVKPDYRPVSITSDIRMASGTTRTRGRVEGDRLEIVRQAAGTEPKTFSVPTDSFDLLDACLDDWLHDQAVDATSHTRRILREESWTTQTVQLTRQSRDPSGSVWTVEVDDGAMRGTIAYDPAGHPREVRLEVPKMLLQRCTAEEAQDIDFHVADGRDLLTFPIKEELPPPHRLKSITVQLTWQDIPLEKFNLTDLRQRVLATSEQDGHHTVRVKIGEAEALPDPCPYPIKDAKLAPFLAETDFVKPQHEAIAETARRIVAGKETALEAARTISAWVFKNVESSMIAETLTGPQVLELKKGKCTEYTTLFASLARSVGIPTRIALGERLVPGAWGGHMWNEVYVGKWVPVDASANEVGDSIALIKFVHSDTVAGTQELRWALTESLEIAIEEFEARPSELTGSYTTGVDGLTYTNTDYACRLTAPEKDWSPEVSSEMPGRAVVRFKTPDDDVWIHFVAFAVPPGTPASVLLDARLTHFKGRFQKFELLHREDRTIHGAAGNVIRFRREAAEGELPEGADEARFVTTEVMWIQGPSGYLLNLIASEPQHNQYEPSFNKLLANFESLGDHDQPRPQD